MKCASLFEGKVNVHNSFVSTVLAEKGPRLGIEKIITLLDSGMLSSTKKLLSEELFTFDD